ncbi:hypothetical protein C8R47DRAFT_1219658 [Mycena vitilis]|nr:hypothetical protein C8R47DRAFT_1219658 [Mycena vitilis]
MDDLQTKLREQKIQNHRLESKIGELEIRISHYLEDLAQARGERDRFEDQYKTASTRLVAVEEELKDVRGKYEALKRSIVPQVADLKRKRHTSNGSLDLKPLAPAFREENPRSDREILNTRQNTSSEWILMPTNAMSLFPPPPIELAPTTPQRHSIVPRISTPESRSSSTNPSPLNSRIPGFQAELRAAGVHSAPWSQHGSPGFIQSSPLRSYPSTPTRTTDPRKRSKIDGASPIRGPSTDQNNCITPRARVTSSTTTRITQVSTVQTSSPAGLSPKPPTHVPAKSTEVINKLGGTPSAQPREVKQQRIVGRVC